MTPRRRALTLALLPALPAPDAAALAAPVSAEMRWLSRQGQRTVASGPVEAPVRWASVTKLVTAVCVMQAVEAGLCQLDDPVARHWPSLPLPAAHKVTLRQLLGHQSGLPVRDGEGFWGARSLGTTADAVLALAGPARSAPGSGFQYNNGDYLLLGALLERWRRQPYAAWVAALMQRAGVAGVAAYRPGAVPPGHLQGRDDARPVQPQRFGPAGGLFGSVAAMAGFAHALLQGRLISIASLRALSVSDASGAALGLWAYASPALGGAQVLERRGQIGSLRTQLLMLPAQDTVAIVVTSDPSVDTDGSWRGEGAGMDLLRRAQPAR